MWPLHRSNGFSLSLLFIPFFFIYFFVFHLSFYCLPRLYLSRRFFLSSFIPSSFLPHFHLSFFLYLDLFLSILFFYSSLFSSSILYLSRNFLLFLRQDKSNKCVHLFRVRPTYKTTCSLHYGAQSGSESAINSLIHVSYSLSVYRMN